MSSFSYYFICGFVLIILVYALIKRNDAYSSFIKGSINGLKDGIKILPYLLIMYVAIMVFRASNILNDIIKFSSIPPELFIQGIFRPISSHASMALMIDIFNTYGVDSKEGIASTILEGGNDTTIYVMALYFGSIGIKRLDIATL